MKALAEILAFAWFVVTLSCILTFVGPTRRVVARAILAPHHITLHRARWTLGLTALVLFLLAGIIAVPDKGDQGSYSSTPVSSTNSDADRANARPVSQPSSPSTADPAESYSEALHAQFDAVNAAYNKVYDDCHGSVFRPILTMSSACRSAIDNAIPIVGRAIDWCTTADPPSCMAPTHEKICKTFQEMTTELSDVGAIHTGDEVTTAIEPLGLTVLSAAATNAGVGFARMSCPY